MECPLFRFCNCKTAMCRVALPDEGCYWYRYFKKLIQSEEKPEENNEPIFLHSSKTRQRCNH